MIGVVLAAALVVSLPTDVWEGHHGGLPSISINRTEGVSVTLPSELLAEGSVTELFQELLQKYGPGICSDIMDLNVPHPGLRVHVSILSPSEETTLEINGKVSRGRLYQVSPIYGDIVINYVPSKPVHCTELGDPPTS